MAVRSGAGTGVIVSLVVFVLTTVFLLVLTIVFYAGKTEALEAESKAQGDLAKFVKPQQRSSDRFKKFESDASANGQSVIAFMSDRHDDLMRYLNGDAAADLTQVKATLNRFGVADDDVVRHVMERMSTDVRQAKVEIDGLKDTLTDRQADLNEKDAQIRRMKADHKKEIETVTQEITAYRQAAEQYGDDVIKTVDGMNSSIERLQDQYENRIEDLLDELDTVNQDVVLFRAKVDEYEAIFNAIRARATSPDLLVDGNVIDVDPSNDQVFIDRGRADHIVLGMTFEVYDDAASIRVDPRTAILPRGKASMQVVKVGETTSTCKITRAVPGRPVVRNNVIANAIYDPERRFKFLIHGKFDVDGDGRPSEAEAEHLRGLVVKWGGEVIVGEELPGDLDFLVLGEEPPMPLPLRADATDAQTRIWVAKKAANTKYNELYKRASEAQIPVLNANRFFILIGRTDR